MQEFDLTDKRDIWAVQRAHQAHQAEFSQIHLRHKSAHGQGSYQSYKDSGHGSGRSSSAATRVFERFPSFGKAAERQHNDSHAGLLTGLDNGGFESEEEENCSSHSTSFENEPAGWTGYEAAARQESGPQQSSAEFSRARLLRSFGEQVGGELHRET